MHIINISNEQEITLSSDLDSLINSAVLSVLDCEKFSGDAEVNVTLVDGEKIKALNNEFRNIDKETDVLSFPLGEDGVYDINPENGAFMLGDVVISVDRALKQAEEFGHSIEREIAYLTVHSILHLLGFDHIDEGENKKIMRAKEEAALEVIGLNFISEGI